MLSSSEIDFYLWILHINRVIAEGGIGEFYFASNKSAVNIMTRYQFVSVFSIPVMVS